MVTRVENDCFTPGVMLSLRSIWREAYLHIRWTGKLPARSFGTEVAQDDAGRRILR